MAIAWTSTAPVLTCRDLTGAIAFYVDVLGLQATYVNHRPPEPPVYAVLRRGAVELHLQSERPGSAAGQGAMHVRVTGVEALHAELAGRGANVMLADFHSGKHGLRTFTVRDPEGNALSFAEDA